MYTLHQCNVCFASMQCMFCINAMYVLHQCYVYIAPLVTALPTFWAQSARECTRAGA